MRAMNQVDGLETMSYRKYLHRIIFEFKRSFNQNEE